MKDNVVLSAEKKIDIRFNEIDMMGVVWHGAYTAYLEDAREAFGQKYGLTYTKCLFEFKHYAPVVDLRISYKKPLSYGMHPVVRITYRPSDSAKLIFDYEIFNPEDGEVFVKASTVQVFMDKDFNLLWETPAFFNEWKQLMGLE
jgi:acyl-CoA thioester hydrolase